MRLKADIAIIDIIGHIILWLILSFLTLGLALFFFPYSFARFIIDRTALCDPDSGIERRLHCDIDIFSNLGHIILWMIISLLTFGLGYIFYFYRVWNYALNNSHLA